MNLSAVAEIPCRPVVATWYRAIKPQHLASALNYSHARLAASRYCAGPVAAEPFDILYLAETPEVVLFEVEAQFGSPSVPGGVVANPSGSWIIINSQVQLSKVADLTDAVRTPEILATTAQELTGDWKGYSLRSDRTSVSAPVGIAPTQALGAALYASGAFEGFLAISAKMPYQKVLGVFPNRMAERNFVRYTCSSAAGQMQSFEIP
jgi:hypothetical protein